MTMHIVRMPGVNANEDSAILVRWNVDNGVPVKRGQNICEIETTKSAVEIEAEAEGFLVHVAPPGTTHSRSAHPSPSSRPAWLMTTRPLSTRARRKTRR